MVGAGLFWWVQSQYGLRDCCFKLLLGGGLYVELNCWCVAPSVGGSCFVLVCVVFFFFPREDSICGSLITTGIVKTISVHLCACCVETDN